MPERLPLPREWYVGWEASIDALRSRAPQQDGAATGLTEADLDGSEPPFWEI